MACVTWAWGVTQVVPGAELHGVAWDDPEQAEDADAVEGGVAARAAWGAGTQHPGTAVLQGQALHTGQQAAWDSNAQSVTKHKHTTQALWFNL